VSGSSTRRPRSGAACDPRLLHVLERIAKAVEDQTQATLLVHESNLQLLDELTSDPDQNDGQDDQSNTYLDGSQH
jgi:hypothetical protein